MIDDLSCAWRNLSRSPGYAISAIITLALAIGANAAILAVADAVLFRPLPYADPDRVFVLQMLDRERGTRSVSIGYPVLDAIDEHYQDLSDTAQLEQLPAIVMRGPDGPESVRVVGTTTNYFTVLGVRAAVGRLFDTADDPYSDVALLSHTTWQQRFGGRKDIVGAALTLGDLTLQIVGVLPAGFVFPSSFAGNAEIVRPLPRRTLETAGGAFHPVVRVSPIVTHAQAQAQIDALVAPLMTGRLANSTIVLDDVRSVLFPVGRPMARYLFAAAVVILLAGCANIANLLVVRSRRRERDFGIRAALGAGGLRLARPLVIEGVLIGVAASAVALILARSTFEVLLRQVPPLAYRGVSVGIDWRVGAAALGLGLVAGIVLAIFPAWRIWRYDVRSLVDHVESVGRLTPRAGRPLLAMQVAAGVVLVFATLRATDALLQVLRVDLGVSPANVVIATVRPPSDEPMQTRGFYARAVEALATESNVSAAGASGSMPLSGAAPAEAVRARDGTLVAGVVYVMGDYFEAVGIQTLRGSTETLSRSRDDAAVVSRAAAAALFSDRDPLGAVIATTSGRRFTVVAVVADVVARLDRPTPPIIYASPTADTAPLQIAVRLREPRDAALAEVKRTLTRVAPNAPVTLAWWQDSIANVAAYRHPRFQTLVLGSFGLLAITLTATGVFAIVAFTVTARRRELGIRLALGSAPHAVIGLVMRHVSLPITCGLLLGVVAVRALTPLSDAQLGQASGADLALLTAAVIVVIAVGLISAFVPARRAAHVDPIATLREL